MSPISSIQLTPLSSSEQGKIIQLYRYLELFSEGDPPRNSLFVFAPATGPLPIGNNTPSEDELLIIDPPADMSQRFKLGNQVAALFTSTPEAAPVALLQTVPGGIAHIRIGDHFLDIYSQQHSALVHLPALGIFCGGDYGSDSTVPRLAPGSDGSEELETLRLLARLIKQHRVALYIPRTGNQLTDKMSVMEKLAGDVAYIHGLRRIVTPLALRGESMEAVSDLAESILPRDRRMSIAWAAHRANLSSLAQAVVDQTGEQ
jgi:hypothetical protein